MKIAVVGSRGWTDGYLLGVYCDRIINRLNERTIEIVTGDASGVDRLAKKYAEVMGYACTVLPADWQKYGKSAGVIRNTDIIEAADIVICLWDGLSKGTANSIQQALKMKKELHVYFPREEINK